MRLKKRSKSSRFRGSKTHARGFKKKARGSGHQGGVGLAGTGKRGDQKKTLVLNLFGNDYFGKDRTLRRGNVPKKLKAINLGDIENRLPSFIKKGLAKQVKQEFELNLKGYKLLSLGSLKNKFKIIASSASSEAIEKINSSGSKIEILNNR
jgi:large subunit ribosomal protein L15